MEKLCLQCNLLFKKPKNCSIKDWATKKYCSFDCRVKSQKGKSFSAATQIKKGQRLSPKTEFRKGKRASPETEFKKGSIPQNWKGDAASYVSVHEWVKNKLGSPKKCEHCKRDGLSGTQIHWANKSHKYRRVLSDWIRLCARCHKKYDHGRSDIKLLNLKK